MCGGRPMRVAFVAASIANETSGVANVVRELARNLRSWHVHVTIITAEAGGRPYPEVQDIEVQAVASLNLARGIELAPGLARAIKRIAVSCDCVAVHGFWALPLVFGARAAVQCGLPVLLSPHGMFS